MTFNKLFEVLEGNDKAKSLIINLSNDRFENPFIMSSTIELLKDDSPLINFISDSNKLALVNMLLQYQSTCWGIWMTESDLDKLYKFAKLEVYKINAANGLRYATTKEVAQGVRGLIAENIYPCGEEDYRKISLLLWTFTGKSYYFREAGYKLTYENSNVPKESFYEMILMSAMDLVELFKWTSVDENLEKAIKNINKIKKAKGFKYAAYEKDEITESISIKQLVFFINKSFPRKSENMRYRRALAIVIKSKNNVNYISPLDVSFLREVYDEFCLNYKEPKNKTNEKLKSECETILNARYSGKINSEHFAFKIITTLQGKNFENCTAKQYGILKDALNKINATEEPKETANKVTIMDDSMLEDSLVNISDAIGEGLFDDFDADMEVGFE